MKITALALAGLALTATATSQNIIPPARVGLHLGLNLSNSSPSIQTWRGFSTVDTIFRDFVNSSHRMESGSMIAGLHIAGMFGVPLTRTIHFSGRLGYNNVSANASGQQDSAGTTVTNNLESSQGTLEITPAFEFYDLIPNLNLHPVVGLELGIPLGGTYSQTTSFALQNGSRNGTETVVSGADIPNRNVRAALMLGLGYTVRLDSHWYVQPEISYRIPLTNVSADAVFSPWKVPQLRMGVNIFFGFFEPAGSSSASRKGMNASVDRITTVDRDGREVEVSQLNVEDVQYNEMFPLVPYVFMPEKAAQPEAALQTAAHDRTSGDFVAERLPLDAIEVNRNVLNVIGSRMQKTPQATLTITGTTDGQAEASLAGLAPQRAAWAKKYLVDAFDIDSNRIAVRQSATPSKPSATNDPDGIVENRRIEFASNMPTILAPITITSDNQRITSPDLVTFHTSAAGDDSVHSWKLQVTQAGRVLREVKGAGKPMPASWSIKPNDLSTVQVPVDYEFTVRGQNGDSATATGSLPVEYLSSVKKKTENLPDRSVDKYSLILFDFNKSTLNEDNARILEQAVLPNIRSNSKVKIVGYTDRIGNDEHNAKLSRERAETVKAFLQERAKEAIYSSAGVGEAQQVFNNDSPIGRQLSRTVQVIVETPRR